MRRKVIAALIVIGAVVGLNVAVATAAQAQDCSTSGVYVSTSQYSNWIEGAAIMPYCPPGASAPMTLQRHRWWGWEDLVTGTLYSGGSYWYVDYNCAGTGTHEFRTIVDGQSIGGGGFFVESNHITVTC